jgi:hypothetical protein
MISRGGIDVEGLIVGPTRSAGHAVIVGAKGDAEERADSGGGGDEASAGKDPTV